MMFDGLEVAALSVMQLPGDEAAAAIAFNVVAASSVSDAVYLVELYPYASNTASGPWVQPVMQDPVMDLPAGEEAPTGTASIYLSDRGWMSAPTDAVPNQWFAPRAVNPLSLDRILPIDPTATAQLGVTAGVIELDNTDGGLDSVVKSLSIVGRPVIVRYGKRSDPYAAFGVVATLVGAGDWQSVGPSVKVPVRDLGFLLDQPLQRRYAGTGGLEGVAANAGDVVPQLYGLCRNVSPKLIDPANLVYQFHDRLAQAVDQARDKGAATLVFDADYASYALLIAAAGITAGKYGTCLAQGLVRYGTTPLKPTLDVRGDAQGGYVSDTAAIVRRMMVDRGGIGSAQMLGASFTAYAVAVAGVVGIYFDQAVNISTAAARLLAGSFGVLGNDRRGRYFITRPAAPVSPSYLLDILRIMDEPARVPLPASVAPCVWRVTAGYRRNWTVQNGGELAGGVSPADQDYYGRDGLASAPTFDATRLGAEINARDVAIGTYFDSAADAQATGVYLFAYFAPGRACYDVPLKQIGHLFDLGDVERVAWPRYGLDAGVDMAVIGLRDEAGPRAVTARVFG